MSDESKFDKLGKVKCYVKGVDVGGGKKEPQVTHRGEPCQIGDEIEVTQQQFAHLEKMGRVSKTPVTVN